MPNYEQLSPEIANRINKENENKTFRDFSFDEKNVIRRVDNPHDKGNVWRTAFIRDVDKIMNCPFYNRYADKTQVFSFYKNDDVTRRGLHVQLVSRIARTIGKALHLNLDLIEAISLGHDIGHTPFGHAGERYLDNLYAAHTGRHFSHNIHSVRVLDSIFPYNVSLQTLSGIASHDGELELDEYRPRPITDFKEFDREIEKCYEDKEYIKKLVPSTLEGCVMRISDIIAYIGKDRQDAQRVKLITENEFTSGVIGNVNAEMVNNLMVNIIENSYGKPYIRMDSEHFHALKEAKSEDGTKIYRVDQVNNALNNAVKPMMENVYGQLLDDLNQNNLRSPIFRHHINVINRTHYSRDIPYENGEPNQLVVDYIASMTDDYFIDLHHKLFPDSPLKIEYINYFD